MGSAHYDTLSTVDAVYFVSNMSALLIVPQCLNSTPGISTCLNLKLLDMRCFTGHGVHGPLSSLFLRIFSLCTAIVTALRGGVQTHYDCMLVGST